MDSCYKDGIIRIFKHKNDKILLNLTNFRSFKLDDDRIYFTTTINDAFPIYFNDNSEALACFNDISETLVGYYKCKNSKK